VPLLSTGKSTLLKSEKTLLNKKVRRGAKRKDVM
jgi:hypothetical protein